MKRGKSNDETKPKIKLIFGEKKSIKMHAKLSNPNINIDKYKPPRIPREKMIINRDKLVYNLKRDNSDSFKKKCTEIAYEKALENINLLSDCKDKGNL